MLTLEGITVERREEGSEDAPPEFFVTTELWCEKFPRKESSHIQFQESDCLIMHP